MGWRRSVSIAAGPARGRGRGGIASAVRSSARIVRAGRLAFDAYTGERVGTAGTVAVTRTRSAVCDRCGGTGVWKGKRCAVREGDGRREWSPFELHLPGDEERAGAEEGGLLARPRHLAVLYAAGSYAELERALAGLRILDARAHRLWWRRYGLGGGDVAAVDVHALEGAWRFVEWAMPGRVRVPPGVREGARHYEAWLASRRNGGATAGRCRCGMIGCSGCGTRARRLRSWRSLPADRAGGLQGARPGTSAG